MVVPLNDVFKIRWAVFNEQHVKQEPEQVASGINYAPVPADFFEAIEVYRIPKIVKHA